MEKRHKSDPGDWSGIKRSPLLAGFGLQIFTHFTGSLISPFPACISSWLIGEGGGVRDKTKFVFLTLSFFIRLGKDLKIQIRSLKAGLGYETPYAGKTFKSWTPRTAMQCLSPQSRQSSTVHPQLIRRLCAPNKTNIGISKEILWRRGLKINLKIIIKKETAAINRRTINT